MVPVLPLDADLLDVAFGFVERGSEGSALMSTTGRVSSLEHCGTRGRVIDQVREQRWTRARLRLVEEVRRDRFLERHGIGGGRYDRHQVAAVATGHVRGHLL